MGSCDVVWETTIDDEDGDGVAGHECFLPQGHRDEFHWCARHFACSPAVGEPAWLDPGSTEGAA